MTNHGRTSAEFGSPADVTSDDKLWAALAYVFSPIVPIIIMLMEDKKNRPFIKAHNAQALVLGVIMIVVVPILAALRAVLVPSSGSSCSIGHTKPTRASMSPSRSITDFCKNQGWA